ncbi:MAG: ANTAR domain-containing protein [Planctomycetia bacterium]|nr:ANTAR domain-containing protein [Planctomycetia bacterium]
MNSTVFIAGANEAFVLKLTTLLEREGYEILGTADSGAETIRHCREAVPDVLILTQRLRGTNGLDTAEILREVTQCVVLLDHEMLGGRADEVVYLQMPVLPQILLNTVEILSKVGTRFHTLQSRITTLEANLKDQRTISRAKGKIMQVFSVTEEDAHAFLQKIAMNRRIRLTEAAEAVLSDYK